MDHATTDLFAQGPRPQPNVPASPASSPVASNEAPASGSAPVSQPEAQRHAPAPAARRAAGAAVVEELETLIRARYPLLEIVSWEEERVLKCLDEIGRKLNKEVWVWSVNRGMQRYRMLTGGAVEGPKGTRDPLIALKEAGAMAAEPTIHIFKDFHPFMKEATVVRALRDVAQTLRSTYSSVVLLSPTLNVPPELEKELTVVDFPLPAREELLCFFDQLAHEIQGNPDLHFDNSEETRQRLLEAAVGLTMNELENVFAKILVRRGRLSAQQVPEVYQEKKQIIRKSGVLEYIEPEENIDGVGGLVRLKEWLRKRRRAFHPKARQFGLPAPKGVLVLGVQGCGKSLCAKAVSRFWQMPLLRLDMGQLFGSLVGASEENVRRAIAVAESVAPAILWIDEIDKGFSGLASSSMSDAGTTSRVFATLLTWLQEKQAPVFVIATANNVQVLPPELLRQGRFDEIFFVDLPSPEERDEIFKIHLARRKRPPQKFDTAALARMAEGFSGAEIEQAVISALYEAFDQQRDVDQGLIEQAINATRPLSVLMSEEIQERRDWAEGRTRPAS